jgi:hypothetical protein
MTCFYLHHTQSRATDGADYLSAVMQEAGRGKREWDNGGRLVVGYVMVDGPVPY